MIKKVSLSDKDATFMYKQRRDTTRCNFKMDYKRLNYSKIRKISFDTTGYGDDKKYAMNYFKNYYAKYKNGYFRVSVPICNQENNMGLIFVQYWCAFDCGFGYYLVLVKDKGKWNVSKKIMEWVS